MADAGWKREEAYKNMKREAKAAVAKAKNEACKEWYEKMGTEEGERMIYQVAKQRDKSRRDIGEVNIIKYQIGEMLTGEIKIKWRWRYFSNVLKVENAREELGEVPAVEGPVQEASRAEVKKAIESIKKGKAAESSGLPIDLIKHLGESGVDMMHAILKRVWKEEEMPEKWKKGEIVPIYKQKVTHYNLGTLEALSCWNMG